MRHVVPVNRQARAADIRAGGKADAVTERELAKFVTPSGALGDALDAFAQPRAADAETIYGNAVRLDELLEAHVDGIETKLLGDLVELDLHRETRLRRPMTA